MGDIVGSMKNTSKTAICPCCGRSVKIVDTKSWGRQLAKHGYNRESARISDGCPGSYVNAASPLQGAIDKAQRYLDDDTTTKDEAAGFWRPLLDRLQKQAN